MLTQLRPVQLLTELGRIPSPPLVQTQSPAILGRRNEEFISVLLNYSSTMKASLLPGVSDQFTGLLSCQLQLVVLGTETLTQTAMKSIFTSQGRVGLTCFSDISANLLFSYVLMQASNTHIKVELSRS